MPKVIITRSSEWLNKLRDANLLLDNKKIGTIADGDTVEFEVCEGTHTIEASLDWCSSNIFDFSVSSGEVKKIKLTGFKNSKYLMYSGLLIILADILLRRFFNFNFIILLGLIPLALVLYYGVIKHKKYLQLKEQ